MKIYYHNVSGIKAQVNRVRPQIDTCRYDVIVLTETWFDQSVSSSSFFDPLVWQVFRRDRSESDDTRQGGGVIIAIRRIYYSYAIDTTPTRQHRPLATRLQLNKHGQHWKSTTEGSTSAQCTPHPTLLNDRYISPSSPHRKIYSGIQS